MSHSRRHRFENFPPDTIFVHSRSRSHSPTKGIKSLHYSLRCHLGNRPGIQRRHASISPSELSLPSSQGLTNSTSSEAAHSYDSNSEDPASPQLERVPSIDANRDLEHIFRSCSPQVIGLPGQCRCGQSLRDAVQAGLSARSVPTEPNKDRGRIFRAPSYPVSEPDSAIDVRSRQSSVASLSGCTCASTASAYTLESRGSSDPSETPFFQNISRSSQGRLGSIKTQRATTTLIDGCFAQSGAPTSGFSLSHIPSEIDLGALELAMMYHDSSSHSNVSLPEAANETTDVIQIQMPYVANRQSAQVPHSHRALCEKEQGPQLSRGGQQESTEQLMDIFQDTIHIHETKEEGPSESTKQRLKELKSEKKEQKKRRKAAERLMEGKEECKSVVGQAFGWKPKFHVWATTPFRFGKSSTWQKKVAGTPHPGSIESVGDIPQRYPIGSSKDRIVVEEDNLYDQGKWLLT